MGKRPFPEEASPERIEQLLGHPELKQYEEEIDTMRMGELLRTPLYFQYAAPLVEGNLYVTEAELRAVLKEQLSVLQKAIEADPETYKKYGFDYYTRPMAEDELRSVFEESMQRDPNNIDYYQKTLNHILAGEAWLEAADTSRQDNGKTEYSKANGKEKYHFTARDFLWRERNGEWSVEVKFQPAQAAKPRRVNIRLPQEVRQLPQERCEAIIGTILNENRDSTNPWFRYDSAHNSIVGEFQSPQGNYEVYNITPDQLQAAGIDDKLLQEYVALSNEKRTRRLSDGEMQKMQEFTKSIIFSPKFYVSNKSCTRAFELRWKSFLTPEEQAQLASAQAGGKEVQAPEPEIIDEESPAARATDQVSGTNEPLEEQPTSEPIPAVVPETAASETQTPIIPQAETHPQSKEEHKEQLVYQQIDISLQNQDILGADVIKKLSNEVVSPEQICNYILEKLEQKDLPTKALQKLEELDVWDLQDNESALLFYCTELAQAGKFQKLEQYGDAKKTNYWTEYDAQNGLLFLRSRRMYEDRNRQPHRTIHKLPLPVGMSLDELSEDKIRELHERFAQVLGGRSGAGRVQLALSPSNKYTFSFGSGEEKTVALSVDADQALLQNRPKNILDPNSRWLALQILAPAFREVQNMRAKNQQATAELQMRANCFANYLRMEREPGKVSYEQRAANRTFVKLAQRVLSEKKE